MDQEIGVIRGQAVNIISLKRMETEINRLKHFQSLN